MPDFLSSVAISVISAIAGAVASSAYKQITDYLQSRDSELSGVWEQYIYDKNGDVVKKDQVNCSHIGDTVKGKIKRYYPPEERLKKWSFEGKFIDGFFFATFQTLDSRNNPSSYGALLLHKVIRGTTGLEGCYVKSELQHGSEKGNIIKNITKIDLKWERRD